MAQSTIHVKTKGVILTYKTPTYNTIISLSSEYGNILIQNKRIWQ